MVAERPPCRGLAGGKRRAGGDRRREPREFRDDSLEFACPALQIGGRLRRHLPRDQARLFPSEAVDLLLLHRAVAAKRQQAFGGPSEPSDLAVDMIDERALASSVSIRISPMSGWK